MTVKEPKTIQVAAGSEVDALLDEAAKQPLILVRNGTRYRLVREETAEDIWAGYDPEIAREAMRAAAGSWSDIDAEAFKEFIYRAREEGSRSPDRP